MDRRLPISAYASYSDLRIKTNENIIKHLVDIVEILDTSIVITTSNTANNDEKEYCLLQLSHLRLKFETLYNNLVTNTAFIRERRSALHHLPEEDSRN